MTQRTPTAELERRILRRFTEVSRRKGPSAVVMADLARDLGMSTKTVYRVFPTKADLVRRLVESWVGRLERDLRAEVPDGEGGELFVEHLFRASEVFHEKNRQFGQAFWDELDRDYPEASAVAAAARQRLRERMIERLRPHVRRNIDPALAIEMFEATLDVAMDSSVRRKLGVRTQEAIDTAVRIWAQGALWSGSLPRQYPPRDPSGAAPVDVDAGAAGPGARAT
jgi:AcrR family transcriptional regulator